MHAAVIADDARLLEERPMLVRTVRGLLDEGLEVTWIGPEQTSLFDGEEATIDPPLSAQIEVPTRILPWMRRSRRSAIVNLLQRSMPDLVYAMGETAWEIALDVARAIDRPAALEVWCARQARRVPRGRSAAMVGAYVVPSEAIAETVAARTGRDLVSIVPIGVPLPPEPHLVLTDPAEAIALAIIGGARDVPSYHALLGGIRRVVKELSRIQVIIELHGPHEHEIWREAARLDLLGHLSTIGPATAHRPLLTRCDLMVVPERYGELRSIMFEAMAAGMPVLAADDPFLGLGPGSATIVERCDPEGWGQALVRLLKDADASRSAGDAGRRWIADGHRSEHHTTALTGTFERVVTGGAYRLGTV